MDGGSQRYAFAWVSNTGNTQSAWWWYANVSAATIAARLEDNDARLIDLEPHDGTGRFSCLMVPRDGNAWFYFHDMESSDIDFLANQYASRIVDIERYEAAGGAIRHAMVLRRNDNDLAVDTTIAMRSRLPLGASSGFLLREYQGAASTVAAVHENRVFEPASLMKMVHLFTTARQIHLGAGIRVRSRRAEPPCSVAGPSLPGCRRRADSSQRRSARRGTSRPGIETRTRDGRRTSRTASA